jgi:hypothetical protein
VAILVGHPSTDCSRILIRCHAIREARERLRSHEKASGRTPRSGRQRDFEYLSLEIALADVVQGRAGETEFGAFCLQDRQKRPLDQNCRRRCRPRSPRDRPRRAGERRRWTFATSSRNGGKRGACGLRVSLPRRPRAELDRCSSRHGYRGATVPV